MATIRQILANRRNATRCCGPKTPAGKARSRLNALRHGLAAKLVRQTIPEAEEYANALIGKIGRARADEGIAAGRDIAQAESDIRRVRGLKVSVFDKLGALDEVSGVDRSPSSGDPSPTVDDIFNQVAELDRLIANQIAQLERLDRYERHAFAKRRKALRALDEIAQENWFRSVKNRWGY